MVGAQEHPRVSRRGQVYYIDPEIHSHRERSSQGSDPPAFSYFPLTCITASSKLNGHDCLHVHAEGHPTYILKATPTYILKATPPAHNLIYYVERLTGGAKFQLNTFPVEWLENLPVAISTGQAYILTSTWIIARWLMWHCGQSCENQEVPQIPQTAEGN